MNELRALVWVTVPAAMWIVSAMLLVRNVIGG